MFHITMYKPTMNCALIVLLMTKLIIMSDGNQDNSYLAARYSLGAECQYIHTELKYTCAAGSGISVIPTPCCIPQVRYFELVGNAVTSLRKREFSRSFSNVYAIDLSDNKISSIHQGSFYGMTNLQVLDLSGNRLTKLGGWVFKGLTSLTTLNLGNNEIISLHQGAFKGLPDLKMLRLDNNNLQGISEEAFESLGNLVTLHLNGNQLSILDAESFSGLQELKTLSLASNRIQSIPDIYDELPELTRLVLNNNPLVCDCRVVPLQTWLLSGHSSGQDTGGTLCAWPIRFRGQQLTLIDPWLLCLRPLVPHPPITAGTRTHASTTPSVRQDHGRTSLTGGNSKPGINIDESLAGKSTAIPTASTDSNRPGVAYTATLSATASENTDLIFFDDLPESPNVPPLPTNPLPEYPRGKPSPQLPTVPVTPYPTPTHLPQVTGGRPAVNDRPHLPGFGNANPAGPESSPSGYPNNPSVSRHPLPTNNPVVPSSAYPNGPTANPNVTFNGLGTTASATHLDIVPGYPNDRPSPDSGITTPASTTGNHSHHYTTKDGTGTVDPNSHGIGGSSSSAGSPNSLPITYGVTGHSVLLLCGTDESVPVRPRVKWMLPDGEFITGSNSRFTVEDDGSLRINPLRWNDVGNYRCVVRQGGNSRVILVRLRTACPCSRSATMEEPVMDDLSPVPYPIPAFKCSWTPLVIAVVTTFQGTVVACAMTFCIWYTRCYRRKNFKIRIEDAEKRDSKRLRNSDISVLKRCSNPIISTSHLPSRTISYNQDSSLHNDSNSFNPSTIGRSSHSLSDYMNSYVTQQMRRHHLPVPDYVDLDQDSRDPNDTIYSSLRGRDFSNRRRRIVTQ